MYLLLKNVLEKILAILVFIILIPLMLIIIIFLKLNKIDKIFFTQNRTGKNGSIFKIYKFKTINNDNEVTNFCAFLRNSGLDEIPQIFNIIKGDMSFIGPRPWILDYSKYYTEEQKKRLELKPGITGYAQISNCTNVLDKIEKDIYYVNHFSFIFDLKIIFNTFIMIFKHKKHSTTESEIKEELKLLKNNKKNR